MGILTIYINSRIAYRALIKGHVIVSQRQASIAVLSAGWGVCIAEVGCRCDEVMPAWMHASVRACSPRLPMHCDLAVATTRHWPSHRLNTTFTALVNRSPAPQYFRPLRNPQNVVPRLWVVEEWRSDG